MKIVTNFSYQYNYFLFNSHLVVVKQSTEYALDDVT